MILFYEIQSAELEGKHGLLVPSKYILAMC